MSCWPCACGRVQEVPNEPNRKHSSPAHSRGFSPHSPLLLRMRFKQIGRVADWQGLKLLRIAALNPGTARLSFIYNRKHAAGLYILSVDVHCVVDIGV